MMVVQGHGQNLTRNHLGVVARRLSSLSLCGTLPFTVRDIAALCFDCGELVEGDFDFSDRSRVMLSKLTVNEPFPCAREEHRVGFRIAITYLDRSEPYSKQVFWVMFDQVQWGVFDATQVNLEFKSIWFDGIYVPYKGHFELDCLLAAARYKS